MADSLQWHWHWQPQVPSFKSPLLGEICMIPYSERFISMKQPFDNLTSVLASIKLRMLGPGLTVK